jgi:carbonic anhydrase/acetyltransferase-like protein (isoleucine patch superfamily)
MPLYALGGREPRVDPEAYVAPTAVLIGDVRVAAGASVWFGAVLRGDAEYIEIGARTNVQDNSVVHTADGLPTVIGSAVTIGHGAILEGCVVDDGALVGMGCVVLQRARIGRDAVLAAGALLRERDEVPDGRLAAGVPASVRGEVSEAAAAHWLGRPAEHYERRAAEYRAGLRLLSGE